MGLAPYGEPGVKLVAFIDAETNNGTPYRVHTKRINGGRTSAVAGIAAALGAPRVAESEIDQRHKNIAFAVQDYCERAMMSVVRAALKKTNSKNLCLAGGVALNSKANGKILASGIVENLFVQPAASDDGVALGAALAPYLDGGGRLPNRAIRPLRRLNY